MPKAITVHVLAEEYPKDSKAAVMKNGGLEVTESRWDGDYLVFQMDEPGEFVILRPEKDFTGWIMAAAAILMIGSLVIWKKRGKRFPKRLRKVPSKVSPKVSPKTKNP